MCTGEVYQCKSAIRWSRPLASMFERNIGIHVFHCWYCGKWKRSDVDSWKTEHPSAKFTRRMSTKKWKQPRRRRTFLVTRRLGTNRVPFCTLKRRFFGKFDPLMETFLEYETICRQTPPGHVFVESLAEIDQRKVAEVVRGSRHKKTKPLRPIFRALSETRSTISLEIRAQRQLPSFIQIHPSVGELLAKTTFQIDTIIGEPIWDRIADKNWLTTVTAAKVVAVCLTTRAAD